ncbi:PREDICTED: AAA-ATPase At2g46620-like [Nelumbo nucifera]|uniref:AAA-ATPase At2g46620-like n=2 Tax=Nelumbo nucifera TaxID=4432 RepID=A0A1U8AMZ5_NELNU|nr:PREDICTED: AAA-ATPase At2g46620-like [Nelumbo nucifera]DAD18000.1 TPA_asm: hypothetical protein HUJ06_019463 [Nelumbo nucifera]
MVPTNPFILVLAVAGVFFVLRLVLSGTALLFLLKKLCQSIEDRCHVYQFYKVPEFNQSYQENQLYRKVSTYLSSLASIEDSHFANLFSGKKSNEIALQLDSNQTVQDIFLGARVSWRSEEKREGNNTICRTFVLKIRKEDKRRILRPYLQHIHSVSDEIEQRRKEVKLYTNTETEHRHGRWSCVPFTHPSTLDTVAMDSDIKNKVKSDLESFLKSKQYYHRLGRVWKRSYLLYGPSGTGKSSFVAAMAKFLCYDVYDVDLTKVSDDSDLKILLLQTTIRSIIVIEDLDRFLSEKSTSVSLSGVLNFMDGIFSCCGEERVMVFTMTSKDHIEPAVLRPGRIDVHIYFPLCDFSAFKTLANSYLGLKDHKLFPQVEEIFQGGATLSPAEIGEIMIVNRSSPSRALKSVITALQTNGEGRGGSMKVGRRLSENASVNGRPADESGGVICRESVHTVREFRKLYGLLRIKSSRKSGSGPFDLGSGEKEG